MKNINNILEKIKDICHPVSIFLYGSRARDDYLENSDYEIGVLMKKDKYVHRSTIKENIQEKEFSIYPFVYEDFLEGKIDTPFQTSFYLYDLVGTAKTLRGEKIVENMSLPQITLLDLIQEIRFSIGIGLASVLSDRNGDKRTASNNFYKSCLYGVRCLEILKLEKFPFGYKNIVKLSEKLDLKEYQDLVLRAYKVREGNSYKKDDLFTNLSFLNEFIEEIIVKEFEEKGNIKII